MSTTPSSGGAHPLAPNVAGLAETVNLDVGPVSAQTLPGSVSDADLSAVPVVGKDRPLAPASQARPLKALGLSALPPPGGPRQGSRAQGESENGAAKASDTRTEAKAAAAPQKFDEIDKDGSGGLDFQEFASMEVFSGMSQKAVAKLFNGLDKDGSGYLSFEEFRAFLHTQKSQDEERRKAIQALLSDVEYNEIMYNLAYEHYSRLNLFLVIPVLILGTLASCLAFLSGTAIFTDDVKPLISVFAGLISTLSTFLTAVDNLFAFGRRADSFQTASKKFGNLRQRLKFDANKEKIGEEPMDPRTWSQYQTDFMDVVKELRIQPHPDVVSKWQFQGKIGQGIGLPPELRPYKDQLNEHGIYNLEDVIHCEAEDLHAARLPAAIENRCDIHTRALKLAVMQLAALSLKAAQLAPLRGPVGGLNLFLRFRISANFQSSIPSFPFPSLPFSCARDSRTG